MSWSAKLIAAMADPVQRPLFRLRVAAVNDVIGDGGYTAASLPEMGDPIIGIGGVVVQGSALSPGSWSATLGGFSVDLAGDLTQLKRALVRGTFVEVELGYPGWAAADYEVVARGQVQQLRISSPMTATLGCRDMLSALRCRPTSTAGLGALGYRLDNAATTLSVDYTAGDSEATLTTVAPFAVGTTALAALVAPADGSDPFILKYSGTGASKLTGVSAAAIHGTTAVDAAAGSEVWPLWYMADHPLTIAATVFLSVLGTGVHAWDVLPQGDGFSLPTAWVDTTDIALYIAATQPGSWEVIVQEPVTDAIAWLQSWLSAAGLFLSVRQGALTARGWLMASNQYIPPVAEITDADMELGGWTCDAWDADHSAEAEAVLVTSSGGTATTATEAPATLPSVGTVTYDISDYVFVGEVAARNDIVGRVFESHMRIPERYSGTCAGLRLAMLTPGDAVRLYSRQIAGRLSSTTGGLDGALGRVVQVSPDYGAGRVRLTVLVYPTDGSAWP